MISVGSNNSSVCKGYWLVTGRSHANLLVISAMGVSFN